MRTVVSIAVFQVLSLLWAFAGNGGKIEIVGKDFVNFGAYPAREEKTAKIKIRNAGAEPLVILKLRKNCGCASITCSRTNLNQGEEADVEVVIKSNSIFGPYMIPAYLENTDPTNGMFAVTLKGNAVPLVEIKPQDFFYIGRIETNQLWEKDFTLTPTEKGVTLGKPKIKSSQPIDANISSSGVNSYKLHVTLKPAVASGDLQCSISIPVTAPTNQPDLLIGLNGKIGTELIAVPGTFRMPVSDSEIVRSFNLKVLGDSNAVLDAGNIKLPEYGGVRFDVKNSDDRKKIAVTARFSPEFTRELFVQEKIYLEISVPSYASARILCLAEKKKKTVPEQKKDR